MSVPKHVIIGETAVLFFCSNGFVFLVNLNFPGFFSEIPIFQSIHVFKQNAFTTRK